MSDADLGPRIVKVKAAAEKARVSLCALERLFVDLEVLAGPESMGIVTQISNLRMTLTYVRDHFGEPDVLLPAIRFKSGE